MVEHVVAFTFRPEISNLRREGLLDRLRGLPEHYPAMIQFRLGLNVSKRDQRYSHAFSVRFESMRDELEDYLDSDEHEILVAEEFRPLVADRAIVSFEF